MPGKKTISFTLDVKSIENAIRELREYRADFEDKIKRLRELIAERIREDAENGFQNALVSDVIFGEESSNDVTVACEPKGDNISVVICRGEQTLFIEFGAGVSHNANMLGGSLHPWVNDGTFPLYWIGGYGQRKGRRRAWGFYRAGIKDKDHLTVTRGTPAAMPLYKAVQAVVQEMDQLVQEVFG